MSKTDVETCLQRSDWQVNFMCVKGTCLRCTVSCVMRTFLCPSVRFYCSIWTSWPLALISVGLMPTGRGPWQLFARAPLLTPDKDLSQPVESIRHAGNFFYIPLSIRPIFIFCCRSYVKLLDYWRAEKVSLLPEAPLRPEARTWHLPHG